jgi:glutathione S-transferase
MITLYVKTGCRYSAQALQVVDELHVPITLKNVADPGVVDEMIRIGGRKQEPFMVDDETDVHLYEADAIGDYLRDKFGERAAH